jgi:rubrerythrin
MDAKLLESTFLLAGSADPMTQEMAMLDAVFLGETICHSNWRILSSLADELPEGDVRTAFREAVEQVEEQEDEHLEWAHSTRERLVLLQARSEAMQKVGAKAEELVARVRNLFAE